MSDLSKGEFVVAKKLVKCSECGETELLELGFYPALCARCEVA